MTIPIQRVNDMGSSDDTILPIREEENAAAGEDFSDIDCQSSYQHSLQHQCNTVSDIIDYTSSGSYTSSNSSYERFIPIQVESVELFGDEVCLEGQAHGQKEEEEKEEEKEEEEKESELGGSWKTIPAVSSSSASGQESECFAFEPSVQVSHRINPGGGAFEAKEMLGRKPPSGARTAPLPR